MHCQKDMCHYCVYPLVWGEMLNEILLIQINKWQNLMLSHEISAYIYIYIYMYEWKI